MQRSGEISHQNGIHYHADDSSKTHHHSHPAHVEIEHDLQCKMAQDQRQVIRATLDKTKPGRQVSWCDSSVAIRFACTNAANVECPMMTEKSSSALPISTIGRGLVRTVTLGVRSHTACVHVLWSTGGVCGERKMGDTITSTHLTSNSGFAREPRRDTRLLTCATKDNAEVSISVLLMRMRRSCAARTMPHFPRFPARVAESCACLYQQHWHTVM